MNSLQNSVSQRFNISASSRSKGKLQSQMKPQDSATTTISAATPSQCIVLILMAVDHQRIGRRTLGHLCRKGIKGSSTKDPLSTTKEVVRQTVVADVAEAHTHSDLRNACSMAARPTTTSKIVPYSSSPKGKWTKCLTNL
jgi:hypothetical protein